MKEIFQLLSNQHHLAIITFIFLLILLIKVYEIFFLKLIRVKVKDFKDENKNIPFDLLLIGIFLLIIGFMLDIFFEYPISWYLCNSFLIIGSGLGLIPNFFKKSIKKKDPRKLRI